MMAAAPAPLDRSGPTVERGASVDAVADRGRTGLRARTAQGTAA